MTMQEDLALVGQTGQMTSYGDGDDGDLRKGVTWPNPRFTDNGDDTVTDNLTELIWLKKADHGPMSWIDALAFVNNLPGDWRLPNRFELESLLNLEYANPALSNSAGTGQWTEAEPFTGVKSSYYWSSSRCADFTTNGWVVYMSNGSAYTSNSTGAFYVWAVRGGQ